MSLRPGPDSGTAKFREDRFIDKHLDGLSLIKIGEYVRTPLFEPSIRAMQLSLAQVRDQLDEDKNSSKRFNQAWIAAKKLHSMRAKFLRENFKGPEEYCIAIICHTLDEPFGICGEFNQLCQQLGTDAWTNFPYKSLLYLLIQAEMRMIISDDIVNFKLEGHQNTTLLKHPITITTDLDFSIEEEDEEEGIGTTVSERDSSFSDSDSVRSPRILHTSFSKMKRPLHRVYRGLDFALSQSDFQPRTLVAFSHLVSTTLDGTRILQTLKERSQNGAKTTLLEIDQVSWASRNITSLSVFPVEKEVLIWPWIKFYVEERKMIGENLEKVLLKPTSCSYLTSKESYTQC